MPSAPRISTSFGASVGRRQRLGTAARWSKRACNALARRRRDGMAGPRARGPGDEHRADGARLIDRWALGRRPRFTRPVNPHVIPSERLTAVRIPLRLMSPVRPRFDCDFVISVRIPAGMGIFADGVVLPFRRPSPCEASAQRATHFAFGYKSAACRGTTFVRLAMQSGQTPSSLAGSYQKEPPVTSRFGLGFVW